MKIICFYLTKLLKKKKKEIRLFINHVKNEIDQRELIIISINEVSFDFNCVYFRPLPTPPPTPLRNKKDLCAFMPWIDNSYIHT